MATAHPGPNWQDTRDAASSAANLRAFDTIRGVAALIVFTEHYFQNFAPELYRNDNGSIFYPVLNGNASAVVCFFVLTGFVLSRRPVHTGRITDILNAAVKRWPRLAGPVIISSLFYIFGALSGAFPRPDISMPGKEKFLPIIYWGSGRHAENIPAVLGEASIGTFFQGSAKFNDVLWTMHWEFIGSFLVLAMCVVVCLRLPLLIELACLVFATIAAAAYQPYLVCFPAGMLFCLIHERFGRELVLPNRAAIGPCALAACLFSYDIVAPTGAWAWLAAYSGGAKVLVWASLQTIASICLLIVALYNPAVRGLLSGNLGILLGRMSFPIYLLHLFVLCSFTSWMCILADAHVPPLWLVMILFPATAFVLFVIAYPLMRFDVWWVKTLNVAVSRAQSAIAQVRQRSETATEASR